MLGGVNEVDPPRVVAGFRGLECFVERLLGVRVQVIAYLRDPLVVGIARVEQMSDFMNPIVVGAAWPSRRLAEA